jgi:hypothetical protein
VIITLTPALAIHHRSCVSARAYVNALLLKFDVVKSWRNCKLSTLKKNPFLNLAPFFFDADAQAEALDLLVGQVDLVPVGVCRAELVSLSPKNTNVPTFPTMFVKEFFFV